MSQPKNPLHGVTLEQIVTALVDHFGWPALAQQIDINCFKTDPSVKSSLKFLRKTKSRRVVCGKKAVSASLIQLFV